MTTSPPLADRPSRVLIVDDERTNRDLLGVMLSTEGYDVVTATSGDDALASVGLHAPDLILLDVMMPGMDGHQVTRALKADAGTRQIPIIMITALDHHEARMLGLNAGAEEFLSKPVDRVELCVRVRNLLRLKSYHDYVERLDEVDQLKKGFLSTVSHELRTPLTSIRGSLGLLASGAVGPLSDEGNEVVAIAERNAIRLMALINDILDLERLETGRIELQFATVRVDAILRRALDSVAQIGREHGVTVDAPTVAGVVWADADRLVQVLINLLSNAIKFSPPGAVVAVAVDVGDDEVEFRVSDHGRGIPAVLREAIFERFRQVEMSDAREKGGTGLGLAISKSIVEQHGGTIGVDSTEGEGSAFWFKVATSPRPSAPLAEEPVLICGNHDPLWELAITEAGYSVITTSTDEAAWDVLLCTPVKTVLMSGDSLLLARLRQDPSLNRMPVILFPSPAVVPREHASDDLVFSLPPRVDRRGLLTTIRDSLDRGRLAALKAPAA